MSCSEKLLNEFSNRLSFRIVESMVHNPILKELNELRTRISFFLKLDNGKSGLWVLLYSRLMTSSGHVSKTK